MSISPDFINAIAPVDISAIFMGTIAQENARLRAALASVKDRMEVLERIAVDPGRRLASEIDALPTDNRQLRAN